MSNVAGFVLFGAMAVTCAGCSTYYEFEGVIVDGDGKPIERASFGIRPHGYTMPYWEISEYATAADGAFVITHGDGTGIKHFELRTKCDGYETDVRIIAADATGVRIVLARESLSANHAVHRSRRPSLRELVDITPPAR